MSRSAAARSSSGKAEVPAKRSSSSSVTRLIVGQALLVDVRTSFVKLRLGTFALRFGLGDPRVLLRRLGALRADLRFLTMLPRSLLPALLQLAFAFPEPHAGRQEHQSKYDNRDDHDDRDDDSSGHLDPPSR
jgi:hypothetical protein